MRTLLFDLAQSDGERSGEERALLEDIAQVWASETPR
jgi:tellurite resistance protein